MPKGKNSNTKASSGKKAATKKVTKEVAPAPAPEPVQVVATEPAVPEMLSSDKYSTNFANIITDLQQWRSNITTMIANVRALQRSVEKEMKHSNRRSKKQSNKPKREPSGFAKPTEISHQLCDFLAKPYGTEMARTEVTKYLTQYIKQHNLQEPADKRKIKPDGKLSKLLGCGNGDEVTYFNLQKWMKPHFSSATTHA
jgi:upstream activation factor subunit UAF30